MARVPRGRAATASPGGWRWSGRGSGTPELLTLKAVRAIEAADLVEASGRQRWEVVGAGEEKKANLEGPFCIYSCHVAPRQGVWT